MRIVSASVDTQRHVDHSVVGWALSCAAPEDPAEIWVNLARAALSTREVRVWRSGAVYDPGGDLYDERAAAGGALARVSGGWRYIGARDHT